MAIKLPRMVLFEFRDINYVYVPVLELKEPDHIAGNSKGDVGA